MVEEVAETERGGCKKVMDGNVSAEWVSHGRAGVESHCFVKCMRKTRN